MDEDLYFRNQGLVYREACRYQRSGLDYRDLCQAGRLGLIEAIAKYDPRRVERFEGYAKAYIRREVLREINRTRYVAVIPSWVCKSRTNYGYGVRCRSFKKSGLPDVVSDLAQAPAHEPTGSPPADLERAMGELNEKDVELLRSLYGLFGTRKDEEKVVAARLGVDRRLVATRKRRALRKLRRALESLDRREVPRVVDH